MQHAISQRLVVAKRGKYLQLPVAGQVSSQWFGLACNICAQVPRRLVVGVDHNVDGVVPVVDRALFGEAGVFDRAAQFIRLVRRNWRSVGLSATEKRCSQGECRE